MGSTTSLGNTPQAKDDLFTFAFTGLSADSLSTVSLNVMANDLGGNAKTLYSVDDGTNTLADLTNRDAARTEAASSDYSAHGARIWITADGKVSYDASTLTPAFIAQLKALAPGQYLSDTFTYAIQLGNGTLSWATATVQIAAGTNANHPAVIETPTVADVSEDSNVQGGNLVASGTISITDADAGQGAFQTAVTGTAGNLGTLSLQADGHYSYSVLNSAVQSLGANDTHVDSFTVTSLDGTQKQVSFTVHGANDGASIGAPTVSAVTEDTNVQSGNLVASGTISISDTDAGQSAFQTAVSGAAGNFGSLSLQADGHYSYSVLNSAVQSLGANDTHVDSFTVTSLDGTQKQVSFTINGKIDTPTITTTDASAKATDASIDLHISVQSVDTIGLLGQVRIDGVPGSYALSAGTQIDDGQWLVSAADLAGLKLNLVGSAGAPGHFDLHVTAVVNEGAASASSEASFTVTITPGAAQRVGHAVDGYIAGATVFSDDNLNGILDNGEFFAVTNADGSFTLDGGSGPLVMFGGTDISTGLAFQGVMTAPTGSTVITPLTTLVQSILAQDTTGTVDVTTAQNAVKSALGIADASVDLTTFDAVAQVAAGNSSATDVLAAAVQVQTTIAQISAVGADGTSVTDALANIVSSGAPLDLTASATISNLATISGVDSTTAGAVAQVIADSNNTVASASTSSDPTTILTEIAKAATVALGTTSDALANYAADSSSVNLNDYTGAALDAQVAVAEAAVVSMPLLGTLGADTLTGTGAADAIAGLGGNDTLIGGAGNDVLDGGSGVDLASYANATAGVTIHLAAGSADGDASVGHDTLVSIERVTGSNSADTYDAAGFNAAVQPQAGVPTNFNEFEGRGGDDSITGNGNTRISYLTAAARVTVDIALGTGHGTDGGDIAGVANDTFSGVNGVRGSNFDDVLLGSNTSSAVTETFEGRGGNDTIDGRGGLDRASYNNDASTTAGIVVNLAAGTVAGDGSVGSDTLHSVELIRGTSFADTYTAAGFTGDTAATPSANAGSLGTFNEFEGMGGNDQVTGNGNTRVSYLSAAAGVTVDLAAGTGAATAAGDIAGVGIDSFTGANAGGFAHGISAVRGSTFADVLLGSSTAAGLTETFEGWGGDDLIDGRGGTDLARYDNTFPGQPFGALGITVDMAAGTVDGLDATAIALVGHDTLRSIEAVRGTSAADTYKATGFTGDGAGTPSANAGSNNSSFNEFEGMGGNDTVTGNGNTRVSYANALAGVTVNLVTVNLATGTAFGTDPNSAGPDPLDAAGVGVDTIVSGVTRVRGSSFNDKITGAASTNDVLQGGAGNDAIDGGAGGVDIAVFSGSRGTYGITSTGVAGSSTVTDNPGSDGVDTLTNVELIEFSDTYVMNQRLLDLSTFTGLTAGKQIIGTLNANGDILTMGLNANGRSIDLSGGGADTLVLASGGSYSLNLANVEILNTTNGNNETVTLVNSANGMTIDLGAGNDTINMPGAGGNNVTVKNIETINAGNGNDTVTAFLDPSLTGQSINLGNGTNVLNLAGANTSFTISVAGANLTVNDQTANATEQLTVTNQQFATTFNLGAGTDTLNLTAAAGNNVTVQNVEFVNGGTGNDALILADSSTPVTVQNIESIHGSAGSDSITLGTAGAVTINSVENVTGSGGNDTVTVQADIGVLSTTSSFDLGPGDDTVNLNFFGVGSSASLALTNVEHLTASGGVGTVNLSNGSAGLTSVDLGNGVHTLNLGSGNHSLSVAGAFTLNSFGGNNDTISYDPGPGVNQTVNLGFGTDTLTLTGSNQALSMSISGGSLTVLDGTTGGNVDLNLLNMQAGATYNLGAGNDTLHLSWDGDPNHFNVVSVQNVESVIGSGNSDQIHFLGNSSGITSVTGGGGADLMWASANEDHFVYHSTGDSPAILTGRDTINDFDVTQDVIDLRGLNVTHVDQTQVGGQTVIDLYTDGHTVAPDMEIGLTGTLVLTASNFLLV